MKKVIITFEVERTFYMEINVAKNIEILRESVISNSNFYSDTGTLMVDSIVKEIIKLDNDIIKKDVTVVFPEYTTSVEYYKQEDVDGLKASELKDLPNSKLRDKMLVKIGENIDLEIFEAIYYNKKTIENIVNEFYKHNIAVSKGISYFTALHNSSPLCRSNRNYVSNADKLNVIVSLGLTRTSFIIMINNLPVAIRYGEHSIYNVYSNLHNKYPNISFGDVIGSILDEDVNDNWRKKNEAIVNTEIAKSNKEKKPKKSKKAKKNKKDKHNTDEAVESGEVEESESVSNEASGIIHVESSEDNSSNQDISDFDSFMDFQFEGDDYKSDDKTSECKLSQEELQEISSEISEFMQGTVTDLNTISDYVYSTFSTSEIDVITNCETLKVYIESSDRKVVKLSSNDYLNINGRRIIMNKGINTGLYMASIGAIVESLKKGSDYYE